jgi:hypothetical protein
MGSPEWRSARFYRHAQLPQHANGGADKAKLPGTKAKRRYLHTKNTAPGLHHKDRSGAIKREVTPPGEPQLLYFTLDYLL